MDNALYDRSFLDNSYLFEESVDSEAAAESDWRYIRAGAAARDRIGEELSLTRSPLLPNVSRAFWLRRESELLWCNFALREKRKMRWHSGLTAILVVAVMMATWFTTRELVATNEAAAAGAGADLRTETGDVRRVRRRCGDTGFCVRQTAFARLQEEQAEEEEEKEVFVVAGTLACGAATAAATLADVRSGARYVLHARAAGAALRVRIVRERGAAAPSAPAAAAAAPFARCRFGAGAVAAAVHNAPFRLLLLDPRSGRALAKLNHRAFLRAEAAADSALLAAAAAAANPPLAALLNQSAFAEQIDGFVDSKPNGPTSIAFDLTFYNATHVYGLPEHPESFALKSTRTSNTTLSDPYRLYNLDVPFYGLEDTTMGLYGSIPFMLAHSPQRSLGVLWMNPSEMFVDITKSKEKEYIQTHWIAESGAIDLLLFPGPTPRQVTNQLTFHTGRPALPQSFATGYHQCRYSYMSQNEVFEVDSGFDSHDIPYDVLWLDIDHTNEYRYFTWDSSRFPDPIGMQEKLSSRGRKMVTIVDPHIKIDPTYKVYKSAKQLEIFVKKPNGIDDGFGDCWPGNSTWIDFIDSNARSFWSHQFSFDQYNGSTPSLYTWNDMNEPSVFSGPEMTMPKDFRHNHSTIEHREIHNAYGHMQQKATFEGHILRSNGTDRPFVLSRSFYTGSQQYGAVWTGDNAATWKYLQSTIPMILSISIAGLTFVGADVGGFHGNTDAELFTRWMQAAAFQPFFRGHAVAGSRRREPWMFGEPYTSLNRAAIRRRYILAPYIYTLFWESSVNGAPIMRPMMWEFPDDSATFDIDNAVMLGSALLVHPVVYPDVDSVQVYLPPSSIWYDFDTFELVAPKEVARFLNVQTPIDKIPVFLRGGSIIPLRESNCASLTLCVGLPYSLIVSLDPKGKALGTLYTDDGHSFKYKEGHQLITSFAYASNSLNAAADSAADAAQHAAAQRDFGSVSIARIQFVGLRARPTGVRINGVAANASLDVRALPGGVFAASVEGIGRQLTIGAAWHAELVI